MARADREAELDAWLRAQPLALVDFYADWCQPCRIVSPLVARIAARYEGRLPVAKVNVDGYPQAVQRYQVASVPTLMIFKDGQPASRLTGVPQPEALVEWLREHVGA